MTHIYPQAYMGGAIVPMEQANLSVASSAVLYGLSVYTVFSVVKTSEGYGIFRLREHHMRLRNSAKIIGIDADATGVDSDVLQDAVRALVEANAPLKDHVFVRATVHVDALVPGTRSRRLSTMLSMFMYDAKPIIPQEGARLKTSVWRRVPDNAIPSRAKVNGAYVNSVLGKQDALDSGFDDCLFLDINGHVCELSAANIFMIRDGVLITPPRTSDILEGITRKTVFEIASALGISTEERDIDLTELYIADEVFACGTSTFIAPITDIDARIIGDGATGPITEQIRTLYTELLYHEDSPHLTLL